MQSPPVHCLVIGCGSIGERHVRTFLATGRTSVLACDPRPEIRARMQETYGVSVAADWKEALRNPSLQAVVIATPAPLHVPMAVASLDQGLHVLIEKPLALETAGTASLVAARDRAGKFVAIAYIHHCNPTLQAAREFIRSGNFGAVRHATIATGHHFPSARPAYRDIYYRDHTQGGGAIQDALTHMANCVEWVLGPTERVYCDASHQVLEGVEVEDTVNVAARNAGALVSYSLNQFQAPTETRLDFHAENGSVRIEMQAFRWGTMARGASEWTWRQLPKAERDQGFIAQAAHFLDGCAGKQTPLCSLEEGIQTLRFNLAALQSWRENRPVAP
ncbi:MAG: Gfo/Idh/MocA family oxidoreductase [Opitutaceae bacterium]|nr:Gfo/Idh/MocA family oxidoreductase [Opitutaceae bacterium]